MELLKKYFSNRKFVEIVVSHNWAIESLSEDLLRPMLLAVPSFLSLFVELRWLPDYFTI